MTDWPARVRPWLNALLILLLLLPAARLVWLRLLPPGAPAPAARENRSLPPAPRASLDISDIRQAHLFGQVNSGGSNGELPESTLSLKLKGVIAAGDNPHAVAIFDGGEPQVRAARVGMSIQPGVTIKAVLKDRVIINNNGRDERIPLQTPPPIALDSRAGAGSSPGSGMPPPSSSPSVVYLPGNPGSARSYMSQSSPGYSGGSPQPYPPQQQAPYTGYTSSGMVPGGGYAPPSAPPPNWQTQ